MQWLRRTIVLGLLSWLAVLLLRRWSESTHPDGDVTTPEWPPLVIAGPVPELGTDSSTAPPAPAALSASPASAWLPAVDGGCPDGYPIKVATSGIYHQPGGLSYERTRAQRCYARAQDAEADGYRRAKR